MNRAELDLCTMDVDTIMTKLNQSQYKMEVDLCDCMDSSKWRRFCLLDATLAGHVQCVRQLIQDGADLEVFINIPSLKL